MPTVTLLSPDPEVASTWPPTTRHYEVDDGTWLLVEVDEDGPTPVMQAYAEQVPVGLVPKPTTYVRRPTVILPAGRKGFALSLDVLHRFDPGTSHETALLSAGYEITTPEGDA